MRIVAGDLRGRTIYAPESDATRPTIDRVREAMFSSLYSLVGAFDGITVLDAFAGSGALGIEALSRGVQHAVFYENGKQALKTLKRNVETCGLSSERVSIYQKDVFTHAPTAQHVFDIAFFDPPYAYDAHRVLGLARTLFDNGKLSTDAILVYEHDIKDMQEVENACQECGFAVLAHKRYGKTGVVFAEQERPQGCSSDN